MGLVSQKMLAPLGPGDRARHGRQPSREAPARLEVADGPGERPGAAAGSLVAFHAAVRGMRAAGDRQVAAALEGVDVVLDVVVFARRRVRHRALHVGREPAETFDTTMRSCSFLSRWNEGDAFLSRWNEGDARTPTLRESTQTGVVSRRKRRAPRNIHVAPAAVPRPVHGRRDDRDFDAGRPTSCSSASRGSGSGRTGAPPRRAGASCFVRCSRRRSSRPSPGGWRPARLFAG